MDSGCSFHMTLNKEWFETIEFKEEGKVLLGNNKACRVLGKGLIRIQIFDGLERT